MKLKFLIIFSLIALFSCQEAQWGPKSPITMPKPAKRYAINLEDSYKVRWSQIMTENKEPILELVKIGKQYYAPMGTEDIPESVIRNYDEEFYKEIAAIAELLGVPVVDVFWLNVMYEAFAFCTSIVVQDKDNYIFMGRNLDYSINKPIAKVAFHIDYYRGGWPVFKANVLGGFVGFITAEKPGKFAISANQRTSKYIHLSTNNMHFHNVVGRGINFLELFFNKRKGILLTIRRVLETAETYQEAVSMLKSTQIIAPAYYIVAGVKPNEGCVITMNRDGVYDVAELNVAKGIWFLAQTNYDRDLPEPSKDSRRNAAEKRINEIGRNKINHQNLLDDVLALYPNFNSATIVSVVFSAQKNYWNTTVWI